MRRMLDSGSGGSGGGAPSRCVVRHSSRRPTGGNLAASVREFLGLICPEKGQSEIYQRARILTGASET